MGYDKNLVTDRSAGMPRLLEIMRALRDPDTGCPWDIEQDFKSIAPYSIEELMKSPTPSSGKIGRTSNLNWAISSYKPSITRRWPAKRAILHSGM